MAQFDADFAASIKSKERDSTRMLTMPGINNGFDDFPVKDVERNLNALYNIAGLSTVLDTNATAQLTFRFIN